MVAKRNKGHPGPKRPRPQPTPSLSRASDPEPGQKKAPATESPKVPILRNPTVKSRIVLISLMAGVFASLHIVHVSTLFENDRHFSHLSTLEREMTFRSEAGMYYSYYKTIVNAVTFSQGWYEITHDNLTEYPSTINAFERFNLLPEVIIGGLYRIFDEACERFGLEARQCWTVTRGQGLSHVSSCEGLRQPEYFYLHAVWICAGLTTAVLFLYGVYLSGSIFGGVVVVLCFFFNHGEATRVMWTPPLRESFAYPFCLLQLLCVTLSLGSTRGTGDTVEPAKVYKVQVLAVGLTSALVLLLWQFSQFVLATQTYALLLMYTLGCISRHAVLVVLGGQAIGLGIALCIMFGPELLAASFLTSLLATSLATIIWLHPLLVSIGSSPLSCRILSFFNIFFSSVLLKGQVFATEHDDHIVNLLRSKLTPYSDFHTLIYTCAPEFDVLGWMPLALLTNSGLLPTVVFGFAFFVFYSSIHYDSKKGLKSLEPQLVYNYLQLGAFGIMAITVMRLKLFLVPQLCLLASLIASRKYLSKLGSGNTYYALLAVWLGAVGVPGYYNLMEQYKIIGEYSNVALEELLTWISANTDTAAVFAGPMPITAAVLLSTRRPIVNHPHYEYAPLRERTLKVYSVFSRKPPEEVFRLLQELKVDYIILPEVKCFGRFTSGCNMVDLWDVQDPEHQGRPAVCPKLYLGPPLPFRRVFSNQEYVVLQLPPPQINLHPSARYQ